MSTWRLVLGGGSDRGLECDGAINMAVDDVLFESASHGAAPALRLYRWSPACLSLGRNQPARGRYDSEGRAPGRDVVRRPTGGLAVFHDRELTYSVTCRVGALGSPRETYRRVHDALAAGLAALGVPDVRPTPAAARAPFPTDAAGVCFRAAAAGEILAGTRKLVGSAQRCRARTILQHGSILLEGSQARARARTSGAASSPVATGRAAGPATEATLLGLLGRLPDDATLVRSLRDAFETRLGIRLAPATLSTEELGRLDDAVVRYRSAEWTWRS